MNSIIPADLLELKVRLEAWRANRKHLREPISHELWNAAADLSQRYPPSLMGRVLKLDPSKLKKLLIKRSLRTSVRTKPQAAFFQLPAETALAARNLSKSLSGVRMMRQGLSIDVIFEIHASPPDQYRER